MKAIECKYLAPTDHRGSRIKATAGKGISVTIPYDYSLSTYELYEAAALALIEKRGWRNGMKIKGGDTETGMVFVFV